MTEEKLKRGQEILSKISSLKYLIGIVKTAQENPGRLNIEDNGLQYIKVQDATGGPVLRAQLNQAILELMFNYSYELIEKMERDIIELEQEFDQL